MRSSVRQTRGSGPSGAHTRPLQRPWTALFIASLLAVGPPASAHGGGLNAEGCHNDRKNGGYHCHRAPGGSSRDRSASRPPAGAPLGFTSRAPGGAFANCAAARAAGAAPVRRGEPGYGPHLDRDSDGVGCEPYRGR